VVGVLLWYAVDLLYNYEASGRRPLGYNIDNVYNIELRYNWTNEEAIEHMGEDNAVLYRLISEYRDIEEICYYCGDTPFTDMRQFEGYCTHDNSSRIVSTYIRYVSPEFFDVFDIKPLSGTIDRDRWVTGEYPVPAVISLELADSLFGSASQAVGKTMFNPYFLMQGTSTNYKVMAVTPDQKPDSYSRYQPMIYLPVGPEMLGYSNFAVRVRDDAGEAFAQRFYADMREPLERGVFYLLGARSLSDMKSDYDLTHGTVSYVRTLYSVIAFFMFTVFLIVLGTFMLRVKRRRGEMALRLAMGSTRRQALGRLIGEGLVLLVSSLVPAAIIAANIMYADLTVNTLTDASWWRFVVTFCTASLLLAAVIVIAVWPAARSAMKLSLAVALHDE